MSRQGSRRWCARRLRAFHPDLMLFAAGRPTLAIEMKTDTGRASKEQLAMHQALVGRGVVVRVCRGADEAYEALLEWLG